MELGIRLSFGNTSEFRGGGTPHNPLGTPLEVWAGNTVNCNIFCIELKTGIV
jgi:hypothetical protein